MAEIIKRLYISGYQSFEMGVFNQKDPRVTIIKRVLKRELKNYLENGLEWVMTGGNLGCEIWAGQVALELKKEYPELKLAMILPFEEFGGKWNEANQLLLTELQGKADFVDSVSHHPYQNPVQFRNYTQFMLQHTDGALLVYDPEFPGKTKFLLSAIEKFQEQNDYLLQTISMDDLENSYDLDDSV